MGTPNPCPPFCEERYWFLAQIAGALAAQLRYMLEHEDDDGDQLERAAKLLEEAAAVLVEPGKKHSETDGE